MSRITQRLVLAVAKIDPSVLVFASSVCDAHWLHRYFGGC
jgi:hypothetical protein